MDDSDKISETVPQQESATDQPADGVEHPEKIGRYRVERLLGEGGFGRVYLARDDQLQRYVAIKVPHAHLVRCTEDADAYLAEARTVVSLEHPNVVPVYDVGNTDEFPCYIVSKVVEGEDLAASIKAARLPHTEAAKLVATVAEALHYAHKCGVVHRDIKPGNILIDTQGEPFIVDFGLALREQDLGTGRRHVGTPRYMSPEQARGEGHRVDGRSDIFSLGVVLYELLVWRRPFRAERRAELREQITSHEPRPPRQIDDGIPKELERICLKALSKRSTERYTTAKDMAEDLRHFLATAPKSADSTATIAPGSETGDTVPEAQAGGETPPATPGSDSQPIRIVPKGLRAFDEHDADFFLELLPGPRDRQGLPENIRFWKTRIEETDPDKSFSVGLIYGPSGCGKSSLVRAGLLPRLAGHVKVVYVEATEEDTETRLLRGIRNHCRGLPSELGLKDTLAALRRGLGVPANGKVLIVLDQFEQWLHAKRDDENAELVQALRQCDGGNVQCIVLVRDDFWMAVTRLLRELEVDLLPDHNVATVDLFDARHARRVLAAFGRAYGVLAENPGQTTQEQRQFLDQAVSGLIEDGTIVCVRLALFAEMVKGKTWAPTTLRDIGGVAGIGVTFLDETFSSDAAIPKHRLHQKAAQAVLRALLPDSGTNIKGHMRSSDELQDASGYEDRQRDFDELVHILDSELRLITPTDPEGVEPEAHLPTSVEAGQRYYQLAHDYLVPSLRNWLTRKQKETRRGRAELLLAERAALWNAKPENRRLPSLLEWASVGRFTDRKKWTHPQRKMMRKAGRVIGYYSGLAGLGIVLLVIAGLFISHQVEARRRADYAKALVEALSAANTADVEDLVGEIGNYQDWATPLFQAIVASKDSNPKEKLHASLALVKEDPLQLDFLIQQLLKAEADEVPVIVSFLKPHRNQLDKQLCDQIANGIGSERIRAAAALAEYDSANGKWEQFGEDIVTALVAIPASESGEWIEMLRPVGKILAVPLEQRFRDRSPDRDAERPLVAAALADYLRDDPQSLTELILLADSDREFQPLLEAIRKHRESVASELQTLLGRSPPAEADPDDWDAFLKKQANAAIGLLALEYGEPVWPLFEQTPYPSLRNFLIDRLARLGADHETLSVRLNEEADPTIRHALILALGHFDATNFSSQQRQNLVTQVAALYQEDLASGVHSAVRWTLRRWQERQIISDIDKELMNSPPKQGQSWFVNSQGQTFAVVNGPVEFLMGDRSDPKKVALTHAFAVATHEVTVAQFHKFLRDYEPDAQYAPQADCPANVVTWCDAAGYCNWLSDLEGIPKNQWCYEPNEKGEYAEGMTIPADYLLRTGYRLPTEEEWEYACRAKTSSIHGFGDSVELLTSYAWYRNNAEYHSWSVGTKLPNDLGMFDMHGNAFEWCQNLYTPSNQPDVVVENNEDRVLRGGSFLVPPRDVRSAYRFHLQPNVRSNAGGMRAARTLPQTMGV